MSAEDESLGAWLVRETRADLRNAEFPLEAGVKTVCETFLGSAILLRIVIHSLIYSAMREPPESTRWRLTTDVQVPAGCAPTRHEEFWMRMSSFFAAGMLALFIGPLLSLSVAPVLMLIVAANWTFLLLDPIFLFSRGDNNG